MITVSLNQESFRYDVYSLIKAFYPEKELNIELINQEVDDWAVEEVNSRLNIYIPSKTENRTEAKNKLKRDLYTLLSDKSGIDLPWGTLTGIRPIKLPARELASGKSPKEVEQFLKDTYYLSEEKIKLSINIAQREREILKDIKGDMASLYVGIPICPSICAYCSFSAHALSLYKDKIDIYIRTLMDELDFISNHLKKKLVSIYIGGGTPTVLSASQLSGLIGFIKSKFDLSLLREFSVECGRPDSIDEDKIRVLKECGVTRICINPQTMNDKTLRLIGRSHSVEDIYSAFDLVRSQGDFSINSDIILGLPGEGVKEVETTLKAMERLEPENLTVHALSIKRSSRMHLEWNQNHVDFWESKEVMDLVHSYTEALDYQPYYLYRQKQIAGNLENVGYSKKDFYCLYNILIMGEYQDIISAGAGGVSKFLTEGKPKRVENVKDIDTYIKNIEVMKERKAPWL